MNHIFQRFLFHSHFERKRERREKSEIRFEMCDPTCTKIVGGAVGGIGGVVVLILAIFCFIKVSRRFDSPVRKSVI